MPEVDLIYDSDCPNVGVARAQLLRAFVASRLEARWSEWRTDDADAPPHVRGFGSPTLLVDGVDVSGMKPVDGIQSCRLYGECGEPRGAPSVERIRAALLRSRQTRKPGKGGRWNVSVSLVPAVGTALLPKLACPACWPAYAGLLSSVGLGFLLDTPALASLTAAFLGVSIVALTYRAQKRRAYGPAGLGVIAAATILAGKFILDSDGLLYAGLAALVTASLWNIKPARRRAWSACACAHA